jgi:hypothetical protein
MQYANEIGFSAAEAERAFGKAVRAGRRASLTRRALRRCIECATLGVFDASGLTRSVGHGVRDIPVEAIAGTLEPHRAAQFDSEFRPTKLARRRWTSIWLAEHRGVPLPPISVASVGGAYAVRDGHHRVSVARARGALTIAAVVA